MKNQEPTPLVHKIDCVSFYVPDLDAGLAFYRDKLGHTLIWRAEHALGLRLPATVVAILRSVDTTLPAWLWPRIGMAILRAGPAAFPSVINALPAARASGYGSCTLA